MVVTHGPKPVILTIPWLPEILVPKTVFNHTRRAMFKEASHGCCGLDQQSSQRTHRQQVLRRLTSIVFKILQRATSPVAWTTRNSTGTQTLSEPATWLTPETSETATTFTALSLPTLSSSTVDDIAARFRRCRADAFKDGLVMIPLGHATTPQVQRPVRDAAASRLTHPRNHLPQHGRTIHLTPPTPQRTAHVGEA